jgi:radical SAM protein with 4Fe4S-binding SPASM domain
LRGQSKPSYDPLREQSNCMVNVDGSIWGLAEAYEADYKLGNVFAQRLELILSSPRRLQSAQRAAERMNSHCEACPYYGACDGQFVADATAEQKEMLVRDGCPVREMIGHVAHRIHGTLMQPTARSAALVSS